MDLEERKLVKRLAKAKQLGKLDDCETYCRRLAEHHASLGHYDLALEAYREELTVAKNIGDTKSIAGSHRMIGEMCSALGQFEEALSHVNKYLSYAKAACDIIEEQRALATLGRTYFCWAVELQQTASSDKDKQKLCELLKECRKAYMKSLYVCEQELKGIGNRERQEMKARLLYNLGLACEIDEELDEALSYIARAIDICKQDCLFEDLHRCYINQSNIMLKQENMSAALLAVDKALEVSKKVPNVNESTVLALITKADIYFHMANYPGAQSTLKKAFKMKTPNTDDQKTVETNLRRAIFLCRVENKLVTLPKDNLLERKELYEKMGDACCAVKNFKHAIQCYLNMLECSEKMGQTGKELQPCYVSLYQTYRDNKQYELALVYARKELEVIRNEPKEAAKSHIAIGEILEMKQATYLEVSEEYMSALNCAKRANIISAQASALRRLAAVQRANALTVLAAETENDLESLGVIESEDSESETEDTPTFDVNLSDLSDSDEESTRQRGVRNTYKVTRNEKGETPLHVAAIRGDVERAKKLISLGHPVKERDLAGWTPLHEAANHGHLDMVEFLVNSGADINDPGGKDCGGVTPLHDSASCGHFNIISFLLDKGATVAALTDSGETPLDCLRGWRDRVEDLDDSSQDEYTVLERRLDEALKVTGFNTNKSRTTQKKIKRESQVAERRRSPSKCIRRDTGRDRVSSRWRSASPESEYSHSEPITVIDSPPHSIADSPPRRPVADYRAAINALRQKPEMKEISKTKPKVTAPLLNEDDFVNDWLEDDIGAAANEKKAKRKIVDLVERSNVRQRRYSDRFVEVSPEKVSSLPPISNNEPIIKRPRMQTSLMDAGFESEKITIPESPCPPAPPSLDHSFDFPSMPSPPMSSVSDHSTVAKIRIKVCHHILLVAVNTSREDLTVRWLADEAARRYRDLEGSEPQLMLKTKDGAVISMSDPLNIVLDEEIEATVLNWKVSPLPERYHEACMSLGSEVESGYGRHRTGPDTAVTTRLEECVTSRSLNLSNYCLTSQELKPVLMALKHEKGLQTLDLSGNMLGPSEIDLLCQCLESCAIEHLNLRCSNLNASSFNKLCHHLSTLDGPLLETIRTIDLSFNPLGDAVKSSLDKMTSLLPNLNSLLTKDIDFP